MTNVVGVLIVVLIVTQVNVSSAAKRIRANLPEVTVPMMAELLKKEEKVNQRLEELREPEEVSPEELQKAEEELAALVKQRDQLRSLDLELATLEVERDNLREEIGSIKQQMDAEGSELATIRSKIEGQEDEITNRKPRLVRLPNPRSPDEGAQEVRMIVRGGRVLHFDRAAILDRIAAKIKPRKDLLSTDPKMKTRYDRDKIAKVLAELKESDPDFLYEFVIHQNGHIHLHTYPRDGRGETVKELAAPAARGRRVMAQAFGERNYIRYFVTADSFEQYVAVRRMAEKIQIPVGWIFAEDKVKQTMSLWERKILATPHPDWKPPPPPPPKPGPAPAPPPPKKKVQQDTLD